MEVCIYMLLLKLPKETVHRSLEGMDFSVWSIYIYIWIHKRNSRVTTQSKCDRCFDLFLPQCFSLLWLVQAGGILPACLGADTAFLCLPLIQEPKVIDGFNKVRCTTPNKWAGAGFITNICIWGAVNRADDGRRFPDIPIIKVWTRHIEFAHICALRSSWANHHAW